MTSCSPIGISRFASGVSPIGRLSIQTSAHGSALTLRRPGGTATASVVISPARNVTGRLDAEAERRVYEIELMGAGRGHDRAVRGGAEHAVALEHLELDGRGESDTA